MKTMKPFRFSFMSEPLWMLVFSLAPAVSGLLIVFFVVLILRFVR
jgi:hypothetical protein